MKNQHLILSFALLLALAADVLGTVRYVDSGSAAPAAPFTTWATAATTIQDAVDVAIAGDQIVVTNGTYASGARVAGTNSLLNRVVVDKALMLISVNGPQVTLIEGQQAPGTTNGNSAVRCVYLAGGATLSGFTLANGATRQVYGGAGSDVSAGGVWCDSTSTVITNCAIIGNSAYAGGGGAYGGTLRNCWVSQNSGGDTTFGGGGGVASCTLDDCELTLNWSGHGGAAFESILNNCQLSNNSADLGGGTWGGALNNCLVRADTAVSQGGGANQSSLNNCVIYRNVAASGGGTYQCSLTNCTVIDNTAQSYGGVSASKLANCIVYYNKATNGANYGESDFSYCCTTPMPLLGFGNITNQPLFVPQPAADFPPKPASNSSCVDAGNNAYVATTTDLEGRPRIVGGTVDIGAYEFQGPAKLPTFSVGSSKVVLRWQGMTNQSYAVERGTNLMALEVVATNIVGQIGYTAYTDARLIGPDAVFYRIQVEPNP